MNVITLYDAIGEIIDEFIQEAETVQPKIRKYRWKGFIAACFLIAILTIPVSAEFKNGYVSNLLAPLYGSAQTDIVDKVGIPIEAVVTVGNYTLSADAIIGDRYSFAIVYTLKRADGNPLPEGLYFENDYNSLNGDLGGGICEYILSEDCTSLKIVQKWTSSTKLPFNRNATIEFSNLMQENGNDNKITVAEGTWRLKFIVRYERSGKVIPLETITVKDDSGIAYCIQNIELSPVGVHFDMTVPNPNQNGFDNKPIYQDFTLSIILDDSTEVRVENWNIGTYGDLNSDTLTADFGALFDIPIPIENIVSLRICQSVVKLP